MYSTLFLSFRQEKVSCVSNSVINYYQHKSSIMLFFKSFVLFDCPMIRGMFACLNALILKIRGPIKKIFSLLCIMFIEEGYKPYNIC